MLIGYHAVYDRNYSDAIDFAARNSFNYVQFDLNIPRYYLQDLSEGELDRIKDQAGEKNILLTFHAPGDNIGLFIDLPAIRQAMLDHFKQILKLANQLGARHMTFHPLCHPVFTRADTKHDDIEKEYQSYYEKIFEENLLQLLENSGDVLVCIENQKMPLLARNILDKLLPREKKLCLTLDIPKLFAPDGTVDSAAGAFYAKHRTRIKEIHLHDANYGKMEHLNIGDGQVNFRYFFPSFLNDDTAITIEVRPREMAVQARRKFLGQFGARNHNKPGKGNYHR